MHPHLLLLGRWLQSRVPTSIANCAWRNDFIKTGNTAATANRSMHWINAVESLAERICEQGGGPVLGIISPPPVPSGLQVDLRA
jgi:hypothetical protein